MVDFGYDVANYCDIHLVFGTLDDFQQLLDDAHQRQINVILDFVPNHTSDQHPWFQESRLNRINPKRYWCICASIAFMIPPIFPVLKKLDIKNQFITMNHIDNFELFVQQRKIYAWEPVQKNHNRNIASLKTP